MAKSSTKKQKVKKEPKKDWEMIEYIDYLDDPRKQKAANILAYSGYRPDQTVRGAITSAARAVGVNRMTIYEWLKEEKMQTAVSEAKAELCAMALNGLRELVKDKNFGACAFLLERLQPEQFSQQHKRMEHERYMFELEETIKSKLVDNQTPPTIIIEAPQLTKDYDRNKLD